MADPNLEAFYAELDARMAMPDDEDWQNYPERRPITSGTSELLPPIDNQAPHVESDPTTIARCPLLPSIGASPHTITHGSHGSSKRKASAEPEKPLSKKRGKRSPTLVAEKTANTSIVTSTPASIQDVTSVIEEFSDVIAEPPAKKQVGRAKSKSPVFLQETSVVTTPGSTDARTRSKASVVRPKPSVMATATAKQSAARKKAAKAKPELITPAEFARRLQEQAVITDSLPPLLPQTSDVSGRKARQSSVKLPLKAVQPPQYLKDLVIFYTGGDLTYASARTRGCMNYIHRHGGTVLAKFDPATTTHIVTETNEKNTLRALGLKSLSEIPLEIPTVYWSWVLSGKAISGERDKQQMDYEFMHAAFPSRMDAGRPLTDKCKGKQKVAVNGGQALQPGEMFVSQRAASPNASSRGPSCGVEEGALLDQPPPETRKGKDTLVISPSRRRSRSPPVAPTKGARKMQGGYICDDPTRMGAANSAPCVNQDIIDKLSELAELHRAKPTQDDRWRVLSYTKAIAALRRCGERISSVAQATSLNGVGEKTALKIMEIIETGALRRVDAERTEDVAVVQFYQGIYGVGQSTAYAWYFAGCRTLEDIKERKGGIELTQAQVLGLKYYDDINTRMPREEASEIFGEIKAIALSLDPKLFVEIMGSYRRGKSTCGDIDVMITRSPDDGRTHAGIIPKLLSALRSAGIVTEDLSLSSDARDNLECTYRGLCVRPMKAGQEEDTQAKRIRRRIDILAIPWESRGAALLYFTGDDIFNRSMRLKANKMGYSLNQRGLFAGVVRSIGDRTVKTNAGHIIASETEEDVFRILGVPWVEPHERAVRG